MATAQTTPHEYKLITELADLQALVAQLQGYKEICFDTETTGFDYFRDRIVGMSFAVEPRKAWYISFTPEKTAAFTEAVRPLFENEAIAKILPDLLGKCSVALITGHESYEDFMKKQK